MALAITVQLLLGLVGTAPTNASAAPADIQTFQGVLHPIQGDDASTGRAYDFGYVLDTGSVQLIARGATARHLAGSKVIVRGVRKGLTLVPAGQPELLSPAAGITGWPIGPRSVAVIVFNFADDRTELPTPELTEDVLINNADSVSAYYQEVSKGRIGGFDGTVYGLYELGINRGGTCDLGAFDAAAEAAAAADGFASADYSNVMYVFPGGPCGGGGLAEVVGTRSWIMSPNGVETRTMAHELAHNFGTHHANALTCTGPGGTPVVISNSCTEWEYGDPFDVMGDSWSSQKRWMDGWRLEKFGWLLPGESIEAPADGEYTISPLEAPTGAPKLIKIARPGAAPPTNLDASPLNEVFLEFRQPTGQYFDNFAPSDPAVNGVSIRLDQMDAPSFKTFLIDGTPGLPSNGNPYYPVTDPVFYPGSQWIDSSSGISVSVLSVSAAGATVYITVADAPGPPKNVSATVGNAKATVAWQPPASQGHAPITQYTVTAWTDSFWPNPAGTCSTVGLSCTVPGLVNGWEHWFTVRASNSFGAGVNSLRSNFITPDGTHPAASAPISVPSVGSTIGSTIPVKLTWTGSDAGSGIANYEVWLSTNGASYAKVATPTAATYTRSITPSSTTTYRFRVRAFDKAGNASAYAYGPTFHVKLLQQASAGIVYGGSWTPVLTTSASGGSYRHTSTAGHDVTYTFTGRSIGVVGAKGTAYGSFKVYLDGTYVTTVSEYATSTQWQRLVYSKYWSSSATHTIRIVCVGTSGHARISLDALVLLW